MSYVKKFTRNEIIGRLRATVASGKPILASGAGCGLTAKCLEAGGIDLIFAFPMCVARLKGYASPVVIEPDRHNEQVLELGTEIAYMARNTPMIAPIEPEGPDYMEMVNKYVHMGFSGVMNFPSAGTAAFSRLSDPGTGDAASKPSGKHRSQLDTELRAISAESARGIYARAHERYDKGFFELEKAMLKSCRASDVFTVSYVRSVEEARTIAEMGSDCIAGWVGGTTGGMTGTEDFRSHEEASRFLQNMFDAAREVNPEIILLGHGGPFSSPEDTRYMYDHTDAMGFIAGSSMERIPIEKALVACVQEFKSKTLGNGL